MSTIAAVSVTVPVRDTIEKLHVLGLPKHTLPLFGVVRLFPGSPKSSVCEYATNPAFACPAGTVTASQPETDPDSVACCAVRSPSLVTAIVRFAPFASCQTAPR